MIRAILLLSLGTVVGGTLASMVAFDRQQDMLADMSRMHVETLEANAISTQLLSGGRWLRKYDAASGHSVYKFAAHVVHK